MNRERLTILRDHLASLPDERVDMRFIITDGTNEISWERTAAAALKECGTAACIAGWTNALFAPRTPDADGDVASNRLRLSRAQQDCLFTPDGFHVQGRYTRSDAIAAIQSMLDSPDDDALPVWPSREGASA